MLDLDLLITNANIVDVFNLRTFQGWAGTRAGRFIYVEEGTPPPDARFPRVLNAESAFVAPGLVDAHMHIESSHLTPAGFARAVLPHGTTTILADPHEVANVAGEDGVRWMIRSSDGLALRILFAIPSCVPATSPAIEWTGQVFDAGVVSRLAEEPAVIALGEVMDYRDVLAGSERLAGMVEAAHARGLMVEGHVPTLRGTDLSEYLSWRITSDHTLTTPAKIREQISKGVAVMIQSKSCEPENMALIQMLPDRSRILLVTDDIEPSLLQQGHLSLIVRRAVAAGMAPIEAVASASIRPARYLGLRDVGGIAPGFSADFVVLDSLASWTPRQVYAKGQLVARDGQLVDAHPPPVTTPPPGYPVPGPFEVADFRIPARGNLRVTANAIVIQSDVNSTTGLQPVDLEARGGFVELSDPSQTFAAVIARNGASRTIGVIKDLGLRRGAVATSFAHDSHNLLVVGHTADDMRAAANAVHAMGGGVAVVRDNQPLAQFRLPVMGLLSDQPLESIVEEFRQVENALRVLGVKHQRPFLMLSLLSLSVSPKFKLTDKGVVDTENRRLIRAIEMDDV